jgi:hypothetical protein
LKRIETEHNFEYGAEFEIALCEVLRQVLPSRVGVCRGYVVSEDGTKAGDDIILFDAARFPTLRLLGESLALKEQVPVEASLRTSKPSTRSTWRGRAASRWPKLSGRSRPSRRSSVPALIGETWEESNFHAT